MKQNFIAKLFFLTYLTVFLGCQQSQQGQKGADLHADKKFYDLKSFFSGEIKRLTEGGIKIEKRLKVNGKTATKTIDKPNFEAELADFLACDINRPAWRDKYTEKTEAHHTTIQSLDKNLKIKSVHIARGHFSILIEDKSPLTDSKQQLTYDIDGGWTIKKEQKFAASTPDIIEIEAKILH